MTTTRKAAAALRSKGRSVVVGTPPVGDMSNFWVIGRKGDAVVLNCQTFSILGRGCSDHPDYRSTKAALLQEARDLLSAAGISFTESRCSDQLFLSGYVPVHP